MTMSGLCRTRSFSGELKYLVSPASFSLSTGMEFGRGGEKNRTEGGMQKRRSK